MTWDSSSPSVSAEESTIGDVYRAPSVMAIITLVLGIVSVVAFLSPFAWLLPSLTIPLGLIALRRIHYRSDVMMGRGMAIAGILLSLTFLSSAVANYFSSRVWLEREARVYLEQWLDALHQRDLNRAHQAVLPLDKRQPEGTLLNEYYERETERAIDRDNFFGQGVYGKFVSLMPQTTSQFDRLVDVVFDDGMAYVTLRYDLVRAGESQPAFQLQTTVTREKVADGVIWSVYANADAAEVDRRLAAKQRRS